MKKWIAVLLAMAMLFALCACGGKDDSEKSSGDTKPTTKAETEVISTIGADYSDIKIGFIFLHDPSASTYDNNFYQAALNVQQELGLTDDQIVVKYNVPEEGSDCYDTACEMANDGCDIVFADSFGHESNMIQAAADYPDVQFCHATGTKAITQGLENYHNAFASIYEGRYLAGVAAGMKLNEMIQNGDITAEEAKIGYVGAWPYAEVKSGYTSFFLGARSVCESATMEVSFTNSWFDIALEKETALNLINDGCVLISQHADSEGAPKACEEKGVPDISYNISTQDLGPNTYVVASKINWEVYFKMILNCVATGTAIPTDWCGSIATGSVEVLGINEAVAAAGTAQAIEDAKNRMISGELKVFDTSTFTVDGKELTTYTADVKDEGDYVGETEVVSDGYFHESVYRSAPYFDLDIDGITLK